MDPLDEMLVLSHLPARLDSIELVQLLVPGQRVAVNVPLPGAHPRGLERKTKPLLAPRQRFGRQFLLGNVPFDRRGANHIPMGVVNRRHAHGDVDPLAILPNPLGLEEIHPLAPAKAFQEVALGVVELVGDETKDRLADHLGFAVAEDPFGCRVPVGHDAVERLADDAVG